MQITAKYSKQSNVLAESVAGHFIDGNVSGSSLGAPSIDEQLTGAACVHNHVEQPSPTGYFQCCKFNIKLVFWKNNFFSLLAFFST